MIEMLIGALVLSAIVMKTPTIVADAIAMVKAANAGDWRTVNGQWERRERRRMRRAAAARALARRRRERAELRGETGYFGYGARDYLTELAEDFWRDRADRHRDRIRQRGPATWVDRPTLAERARDMARRIRGRTDDGWVPRRGTTDEQFMPDQDPAGPCQFDPWEYARPDGSDEPQSGRPDQPEMSAIDEQPEPAEPEPTEPDNQTPAQTTSDQEEEPVTTATVNTAPAAGAVGDMQTNDDARRAAEAMTKTAAEAMEALSAYQAAKARLTALAKTSAEGMQASGHDRGATAAATEAADAISDGDIAEEFARLETVQASASQIVVDLAPYIDTEDYAASRGANAQTLSKSAS
jgi:hypothetical protein